MILLVHLLFGAAIGSVVKNIPLAVILAFLSHYFLDCLPHTEYSIDNITKKQWKKVTPDVLRVALDFLLGILLIFIFSDNHPITYICSFFAILPDGLSVLGSFVKTNISEKYIYFHQGKIHFLRNKKISNFWRILNQVGVVIISILMLK